MSDFYAHETAVVDDGAVVLEGTKIWHFCHVSSGSQVGRDCSLGQNVYVACTARIGDRVKIQNNVSVFDGVVIEDEAFCGPSMVFTNVINPRSFIERKDEYLPTLVKKRASIGANATIVCGNTIGEYAFIGAGAVVSNDVPDFALVVGVPGRQVGWMSAYGERLSLPVSGTGTEICQHTGDSYVLEGNSLRREPGGSA